MTGRDASEPHRGTTPLEWLFDLCFVVAVAQAADQLHEYHSAGRIEFGVLSYAVVFFGIWWAWMNFTWFASAYDTDDIPYRVAAFVQMTGVLVFAAGIPRAFDERDFVVAAVGYAVMRTALVGNWLRVAAAALEPAGQRTAIRFASGIICCQAAWVVLLFLPHHLRIWGWLVVIPAELAVPLWSEQARNTSWHPRHITERYGLFTILVLGQAILASTVAIQSALDDRPVTGPLYTVTAGGLLIVFALWWLYFARPAYRILTSNRNVLLWGYGHYLIFAATAAIGSGLAVVIDQTTGFASLPHPLAAATVTVPVAVFLMVTWWIHHRPHGFGRTSAVLEPAATVMILACTWSGRPVLLTGVVLSVLVMGALAMARRERPDERGLEL
jgi:low temperature requirement protein LtrA